MVHHAIQEGLNSISIFQYIANPTILTLLKAKMKIAYLLHFIPLVAASGSVCTQGIYSILAPLSAYQPAETFCQSKHPRSTVTTTSTLTVIVGPIVKRYQKREALPTIVTSTTIPSLPTTTVPDLVPTLLHEEIKRNVNTASLFSSLTAEAGAIVSTFCSCINPPATVTTTSVSNLTASSSRF